MARVIVPVLLATVLVAAAVSVPAVAQTPDATLPSSCTNQETAPSSVILTCGDAGLIAEHLAWQNWGAASAMATGTASVNTCDPDCATGGRAQYPVTLVAD